MRWFTSRFCDAPDETELTRSRRRRCNCRLYNHCAHSAHGSCSSWRAPTSVIAGIDFSFFTLWQARAIQPTSQGRLDPRLPWQPHDTHLYKNNSLFDRHKPVPFRSDKTLTFSDGAIKRIIDTCLFQPVSSDTVPPLRKMGAVVFFCFDSNETGVFRGGFASSSNLLFASVSHGGVLRFAILFSFDTIHLVFWGGVLFFSSSRKRRLILHHDKKS